MLCCSVVLLRNNVVLWSCTIDAFFGAQLSFYATLVLVQISAIQTKGEKVKKQVNKSRWS
jgi:hypothetical protein